MYIILREDIIKLLDKSIGTALTEDYFRTGRIEYKTRLDTNDFLRIKFSKEEEIDYIESHLSIDNYESLKKVSKNTPNTYEEYKKQRFNDHMKWEKSQIIFNNNISQIFWVKDNIIIASGYSFSSSHEYIATILAQIFYLTDEIGEPSFEDTKTIEWNLINGLKKIIVLPKKISKDWKKTFFIISGKKDFFDKTDIWKTNL